MLRVLTIAESSKLLLDLLKLFKWNSWSNCKREPRIHACLSNQTKLIHLSFLFIWQKVFYMKTLLKEPMSIIEVKIKRDTNFLLYLLWIVAVNKLDIVLNDLCAVLSSNKQRRCLLTAVYKLIKIKLKPLLHNLNFMRFM